MARFPRARSRAEISSSLEGEDLRSAKKINWDRRRGYAVAAVRKEQEQDVENVGAVWSAQDDSTLSSELPPSTFHTLQLSSGFEPGVGTPTAASQDRSAMEADKVARRLALERLTSQFYSRVAFKAQAGQKWNRMTSRQKLRHLRAQQDVSKPHRSLQHRTVLVDDIKQAESNFQRFTWELDEKTRTWERKRTSEKVEHLSGAKQTTWHARNPHPRELNEPTLRSHLNHLLYLSSRVPSQWYYNKFHDMFQAYGVRPDSWTYLARLLLMDNKEQTGERQIARVWLDWAKSKKGMKSPEVRKEDAREEAGERVLANQTMWMLAKRGKWRTVGPVYCHMLENTPAARKDSSTAFPAEYFTPSNTVATIFPAFQHSQLDKITYQSLIRALGYHGNIVPALAVLGDMLRDERGYTADISDYIAIIQGFARFGNSLEAEEAERRTVRRLALATDDGYAESLLELFPPVIYPQSIPVVQLSEQGSPVPEALPRHKEKAGGMRKLTEIWANKIDVWGGSRDGQERERRPGLDLPVLDRVFRAMLSTVPSSSHRASEEPDYDSTPYHLFTRRHAVSPTPRAVFVCLMAFARCTDGDPEVLKSVWADISDKFGPGNQEGWTEWKMDKRLRRLANDIASSGIGR
jgi:hypothetical protein